MTQLIISLFDSRSGPQTSTPSSDTAVRYRILIYSLVCMLVSSIGNTTKSADVRWTNVNGGEWFNANNWSGSSVPSGADNAIIDVPSAVAEVNFDGFGIVRGISSSEPFHLNSGRLNLSADSQFSGALRLGAATLSLSGSNTTLTANGSTTAKNTNIIVGNGATISLPNLTAYTADFRNGIAVLQAAGTNSVLDLSSVKSISTDGSCCGVEVNALNGGFVNLSQLDTVNIDKTKRRLNFSSRGSGSLIDISSLADLSNVFSITAIDGTIVWPRPSILENITIEKGGNGVLDTSRVQSARNSNFTVGSGGHLSFPQLKNYEADSGNGIVGWQSNGAGSVLDLSSIKTVALEQGCCGFNVFARGGGKVDLSDLAAIENDANRIINYVSQDVGSIIDVSSLKHLNRTNLVLNGGDIILGPSVSIDGQSSISGNGVIDAHLSMTGGRISPGSGGVFGKIAVQGNATFADVAYDVNILGREATDLLEVDGSASLDGTLSLLSTGFKGSVGDSAVIMTANSVAGRFNKIVGIPIPNSPLGFAIDYSPTKVVARATVIGDVNFDNEFNTGDLIEIFQAGEYEDAIDGNSTWIDGDWDGDGNFGTRDLIVAFQAGAYEQGPIPARPVPEPCWLSSVGCFLIWRIRNRTSKLKKT